MKLKETKSALSAVIFGLCLATSGVALAGHGGHHGGGHHGGGHHGGGHHGGGHHGGGHHGGYHGGHHGGWGYNGGWRNGGYRGAAVIGVPAGTYYSPVCRRVRDCGGGVCVYRRVCN